MSICACARGKKGVYLIRTKHVLIKDLTSNLVDQGVCDPGAVMSSSDFAELIRADLVHGDFVGLEVVLDRDLG